MNINSDLEFYHHQIRGISLLFLEEINKHSRKRIIPFILFQHVLKDYNNSYQMIIKVNTLSSIFCFCKLMDTHYQVFQSTVFNYSLVLSFHSRKTFTLNSNMDH